MQKMHIDDCKLCAFWGVCTLPATLSQSLLLSEASSHSAISNPCIESTKESAGHWLCGWFVVFRSHERHLRDGSVVCLGPHSDLHFGVVLVLTSGNVAHGDVLLQARAESTTRDLADLLSLGVQNIAVCPGWGAGGDEAHSAP